jgi:hypothetical protein
MYSYGISCILPRLQVNRTKPLDITVEKSEGKCGMECNTFLMVEVRFILFCGINLVLWVLLLRVCIIEVGLILGQGNLDWVIVLVDILKFDLWRNHVLSMYVRMLARGEAWPDHPCFPTSQYSSRDDCVVLGCTRSIWNEDLTIWEMQIIFFLV